jgi:hypothetical protein
MQPQYEGTQPRGCARLGAKCTAQSNPMMRKLKAYAPKSFKEGRPYPLAKLRNFRPAANPLAIV